MELIVGGEAAYVHTGGRPFDPGTRTMLLLHGAGFDHTAWRHQSRYLAHRGWSVAAPDFPGHGRSAGGPRASIAELAEWTCELLDALDSPDVILVGHSMGALVGLEVDDDRVRGRVLLAASTEIRVHPDLLAHAAEERDDVLALLRAWEHASHPGGSPTPGNWMMGEGWRLREGVGLGVLHADLLACNGYDDGEPSAMGISTPVLLVGGAVDRMVAPRATEVLAGVLPDVRQLTLEGAGHALLLEQPRRVARAIEGFGSEILPA